MERCQGCARSVPDSSLTVVMDHRASENRLYQSLLCPTCVDEFMRKRSAAGAFTVQANRGSVTGGRGHRGNRKWWQFWKA